MPNNDLIQRLRNMIKDIENKAQSENGLTQQPVVNTRMYPTAKTMVDCFTGYMVFKSVYNGIPPCFQDITLDIYPGFMSAYASFEFKNTRIFLDIETTGLPGAATIPFLVGLGMWKQGKFELIQYLLTSREHETGMLESAVNEINPDCTLVTFNGKAFDVPLINSRLVFSGLKPLTVKTHIDLLSLSKSLGKHPNYGLNLKESARRYAGIIREQDIPGNLIPALFFIYEREGDISVIEPVLKHNHWDILDMVYLLRIFGNILTARDKTHSLALGGAGKLHCRKGNLQLARLCLETGLKNITSVPERIKLLRLYATVSRRQGDWDSAGKSLSEIINSGHEIPEDYLWLARYYELHEKDLHKAFSVINQAFVHLHKTKIPVPHKLLTRKKRLERLLSSLNV